MLRLTVFCSSLKNKYTVRNLPPIMWCRRVFRRMHTTEIRVRNQYKSPLNGCSPFNSPPPKHLPRRIIMSTEEYGHTVRCKVYQTIVPIVSKLLHFPSTSVISTNWTVLFMKTMIKHQHFSFFFRKRFQNAKLINAGCLAK